MTDGDDQLSTRSLTLSPLRPDDAAEMVRVLSDERLYSFTGGRPPTVDELRARYERLAVGHSADGSQEWRNWIVRRRRGGRAVGTVQATITMAADRAEVAWVIGAPWQGRGYATQAAGALVRWLLARGVGTITAHVAPGHAASERVAARAGLVPSGEIEDGERVWRLIRS